MPSVDVQSVLYARSAGDAQTYCMSVVDVQSEAQICPL
jgi:hypothetical protein